MELTLDNLIRILDNSEFTLEYIKELPKQRGENLNIYVKTLENLLETFFPGIDLKKETGHASPQIFHGGVVHLDKTLEKKLFKGVTKLAFKHFYANIISKSLLIERSDYFNEIDPYGEENWEDPSLGKFFNKKLDINIKEFPILFKFILDNYENIKNLENEKIMTLTRFLLNYTFGTFVARNSFLKSLNADIVTEIGRNIINSFIEQFKDNVLYADIDMILFIDYKDIEEEVKEKMKDINIPYQTKDYLYFLPLQKKNYILSENEIEIRGFPIIENLKKYRTNLEKTRETVRKKLEQRILEGDAIYEEEQNRYMNDLFPRRVIERVAVQEDPFAL